MRNIKNKTDLLMSYVVKLPYFDFKTLNTIEKDNHYLKIFINRYKKKGKIINLKKGFYTTKQFLDNFRQLNYFNSFVSFNEFVANILYQPSYLSLEYVLAEKNILTENPFGITSVTKNKTAKFNNHFGQFFYHKIKNELFLGFDTKSKYENSIAALTIFKASKAKALFDYLYLRKNILVDNKSIDELRLNISGFKSTEIKEFKSYINLEGSKKMKNIYHYLFKDD